MKKNHKLCPSGKQSRAGSMTNTCRVVQQFSKGNCHSKDINYFGNYY